MCRDNDTSTRFWLYIWCGRLLRCCLLFVIPFCSLEVGHFCVGVFARVVVFCWCKWSLSIATVSFLLFSCTVKCFLVVFITLRKPWYVICNSFLCHNVRIRIHGEGVLSPISMLLRVLEAWILLIHPFSLLSLLLACRHIWDFIQHHRR